MSGGLKTSTRASNAAKARVPVRRFNAAVSASKTLAIAGRVPDSRTALLQPALIVGAANDPLEREAEVTAERVVSMSSPEKAATNIGTATPMNTGSRMPVARATEEFQPEAAVPDTAPSYSGEIDDAGSSLGDDPDAAVVGADGGAAPSDVSRLVANPGQGRALPSSVRAFMEPRFGTDFSDVRIHDGAVDRRAARRIGARGFTHGRHIWLGDGESVENRCLIAHELTHVVQQQGPASTELPSNDATPAVHRDFSIDIDIGIGDAIADVVRGLLRRYAPRIEPVITQGPVGWLRDKLGGVFDGIIGGISRLDPGKFVQQLVDTFSGMVEKAGEIVNALISGDCDPLFSALARMKGFVLEVAGTAWDKLSAFFAPVGDFFSDLRGSISSAGSAAIDWIKKFAGDIWETIEDIGQYIWDKTAVIRDYGSMAWNWLKEQLFGPSEPTGQGDSRSGIIGWFTQKATDAWDWVKEQTRPVWEPVSHAIETVKELIPPAFVAELGEKMTTFSEDLNDTVDDMEGGPGVAENREALASILPSVQDIIGIIRDKLVSAGLWIISMIGAISTRVTTFMAMLRANSIVSSLARLLTWLENAVTKLTSWASEKAVGLFNLLVRGFDFLSPWIQKIIDVVGKVISVAVDLIRLPQLIITAAWELIPECIREPIKDFIIVEILGRIPVFNQFTKIGHLWNKLQDTAMQILRSLFVDGDITKAAWTFFSSLLNLIGLPARLVTGILAKAASAIGKILKDPIGFLINMLKAIKEGFARFFANILKHLLNGITGWLFGHVREAGLEPPTEFTVKGVLGFVLQLLDITVERVLERLALKIGREKVDKIRDFLDAATGVWRFVSVLINDGVTGLWEFVQEKLSDLWSLVLDAVIGWVTQKIITEVTIKILSMLDPSGIMAVIQSALAIYRAIETFVEQLRAMLEIVSRVLDGINGIASGAIDQAAGFLENAMARSLTVALAFLANQAGLGGLSSRIKEFVEAVREKVNEAIDWIIDKGMRLGQGFLDTLERGASAVRRGVAAIRDWWRARKEFQNEAGEEHSVYIDRQGGQAQLIIASRPKTYRAFISAVEVPQAKQRDKNEALGIADQVDAAVREAERPAGGGSGANNEGGDQHAQKIQGLINRLGAVTARFMPSEGGVDNSPSSHPVYGPLQHDHGGSVKVDKLKKPVPPGGSSPSSSLTGPHWSNLIARRTGSGSYYIRGHLLNDNVGGPGNTWANLTPLTRSANSNHESSFEKPVKDAVAANKIISLNVKANYGRSARDDVARTYQAHGNPDDLQIAAILRAERAIPLSLTVEAHEIDAEGKNLAGGKKIGPKTVDNSIIEDPELYQLGSTPPPQPVYLSEMSASDIASRFGLNDTVAARIAARDRFTTWAQVAAVEGVGQATADGIKNKQGLRVRLYKRG